MKTLCYLVEAALAWIVFGLFRLLPLDAASWTGGWLGRKIGPFLGGSKTARRNLSRAFPDKSPAEIEEIVTAMWDNLGRVMGEYPHLNAMKTVDARTLKEDEKTPRIIVKGLENVEFMRHSDKSGIFFSGHLGHWEINAMGGVQHLLPLTLVYRAPNNPYTDGLIRYSRRNITRDFAAKGSQGGRHSIEVLREGGHLALLADQKMNDGIPVPFFGRDAMTAPAPAKLAMKFDCHLLPAHIVRTGGANFRMIFSPPLDIPRTGDRQKDTQAIMTAINGLIEGWVREHPEQWMWVHRRWPD